MALSIFEFDKERNFRIVCEDERKLGHEEGFNEGISKGICEDERTARITDIMELLSEYSAVPENICKQIPSESTLTDSNHGLSLPHTLTEHKKFCGADVMPKIYYNIRHYPIVIFFALLVMVISVFNHENQHIITFA